MVLRNPSPLTASSCLASFCFRGIREQSLSPSQIWEKVFEVIVTGGEGSDGAMAGVVQEMLEEGWGTINLEGKRWVRRSSRG